jgi:hypothetical protein
LNHQGPRKSTGVLDDDDPDPVARNASQHRREAPRLDGIYARHGVIRVLADELISSRLGVRRDCSPLPRLRVFVLAKPGC